MNPKKKYPTPSVFLVGTLASAVTALIASILYIIAYHNSYDTEIRHFDIGARLPMVFGVLMFLSVVIFTVSSILLRKKYTMDTGALGSCETFGLWLCGLMFLIFGVISFTTVDPSLATSKIGAFCNTALPVLAIVASVPFFISTSDKMRLSTAHAVSTLAPVLWGICLLFKYYFDLKEMPLNDPELTLTMVSISCAVIFFLCECRISMGIASPAVITFSASAALCLTGSISVARMVLWRTDGHMIPSPMETILLFTVAVLAGCRLYALSSSMAMVPVPEEKKQDDVQPDDGDMSEA